MRTVTWSIGVLFAGLIGLVTMAIAVGHAGRLSHQPASAQSVSGPDVQAAPAPWLMFHRDERHTGVAEGVGRMSRHASPSVRWQYRVTDAPAASDPPHRTDPLVQYRWYSSFPLGDLDGDGTLEVVVTTPDNSGGPHRIIALKDAPAETPPVRAMWVYTSSQSAGQWGFDQYSAALADADGDGLLDVLFCSKDGDVRALRGTDGRVIWEHQTSQFIEAGPMIADLDGDGAQEVIVVTDCLLGEGCPGTVSNGMLYVFAAQPTGGGPANPPLWSLEFPYKLDSGEPAIADLDPNDGQSRKAMVFGSWGGRLHVVWRNPDGSVVSESLNLRTLDASIPHDSPNVVVRSSPLVADFGEGLTAVFGWMPDWQVGTQARISAIGVSADMQAGTVTFTPRWTISRADWKSSPALLPVEAGAPLIVTGYGTGTTGTGDYGWCDPVIGGIIAVRHDGEIAWEHDYHGSEGNVRGSPAVADIDADGQMEVLLTFGCFGKIHAYDGATGAEEWSFQLGPRTIGTASLGDLDGDGSLEIVVPSYDGNVWVLGGRAEVYLPLVVRQWRTADHRQQPNTTLLARTR